MKPSHTRKDGTRLYNIRLDRPAALTVTEHDYDKLARLFPRGVSIKEGLAQALQYLWEKEDANLPRRDHILTEAFHAQTEGRHTIEGRLKGGAPVVTKRIVNEAATSTVRQLVLQDPAAVLRALAEALQPPRKEQ